MNKTTYHSPICIHLRMYNARYHLHDRTVYSVKLSRAKTWTNFLVLNHPPKVNFCGNGQLYCGRSIPEINVLLPKPQKFPYCSIYSTVYVGKYLRPDIWLQWSMNFPRTFATLSFVACRNFPKCSTSLSLHRGGMDWSGDLHMTSVLVMWLSQLCRVLWALQRRLRMHHRLRHMWLRVLCSPTQPSQPAESALCQEQHSGFYKGYECSLWYIQSEAYTQSRNSKSLACLNSTQKPFLSQLHM